MSFPRYSTYKESKNDWVAHVPEHWELMPCRGFVDERTEKNEDAACQSYLSLMANVGIIPYEEKGDIGNKKPEDLSKCKIVCQGDFVINSMNYGIGSYGVSAYEGVCSPVYIVLTPRQDVVEPRFAFRVFEDKSFQAYAQSLGNGILAHRCAIGWDDLKGIVVGIPSAAEQKSILNFLDRETTKIDTLISEQKRLIELLQEKRQAVISHAVTKGLNPNAPMKDSGVEWLGEVPEHWITGKLCYYARLDTGSTPDRQRPEYWNGDIPWVKTGEVRYEDIYETEEKITELALRETSCSLQQPGTLLMALYGQGVTRGRVGMLMTAASCNQACAAITSSTSINERFLELYLTNAYPHVRSLGNETTQQNLNLDFVGKLELLVPPLAEQECIWQATKQRTKELDALLLQSEDAIVLLQERRSALISAAVTGQIDVRGLVEAEAGE